MSFFEFESDSDATSSNGEGAVSETTEVEAQVEEVSPTARLLLDKQTELFNLEQSIAPKTIRSQELLDAVKKLQEETQAAVNAMMTERQEIETELWDARRAIRSLKVEIDGLRRQLVLEMEARRQQEEYASNALIYDKRIAQYSYSDRILTHQKEGAFFLATSGRAILGDKRGLGKTLTSLATADALQAQKILVLCPDDVLSNFVTEINFWSPHRTVFPIGKMPKMQRDFAFRMAKDLDQYIIVCNYSAWRKDKSMIDSFVELGLDMVIADEAHELKNTNTSAFKGVEKIILSENCCPMCKSMELAKGNRGDFGVLFDKCLKCDWRSNDDSEWQPLDRCTVRYVFPMTGTVILNKPQDLFALLHLVDPVIFDKESTYLHIYCEKRWGSNKWTFKTGGLQRLTEKLSGKYIARDEKSAGVVRPKQSVIIHEIEFDIEKYAAQWKIIQQLSKYAQIILDSGKALNPLVTISLILRKRQANVWPAGIVLKDDNGDVVFNVGDDCHQSIKLDKCLTVVDTYYGDEEHEGLIAEFTEQGDRELGSRVVVFSQFKGPLAELERRCTAAGISVVRFDGDTDDATKELVKRDFDRKFCEADDYNDGKGYRWQVCLANYKTGGTGLNFTAATETIFLDEEWNPGKADQAMGRTDRIGQTEETNVHILRIPSSIDTWMVALNDEKAELIEGFEKEATNTATSLLEAMRNGDII